MRIDPVGNGLELLEQFDECGRRVLDAVESVGQGLVQQCARGFGAERAVDLVDEPLGHGIGAEHVLGEGVQVFGLGVEVLAGDLADEGARTPELSVRHRGVVADGPREAGGVVDRSTRQHCGHGNPQLFETNRIMCITRGLTSARSPLT